MATDLLVNRDQFQAQFLETMVLIDFQLGFAPCGGGRKRLGDGFPVHFAGQANLRVVTRVVGLGASSSRKLRAAVENPDHAGLRFLTPEHAAPVDRFKGRSDLACGTELVNRTRALG